MTLVKAKLKACDKGAKDIEFMFNPNELSLGKEVLVDEAEGARTDEGLSKVSFKYPKNHTLNISNLYIDTYETKESALTYINQFAQALEFVESGPAKGKRPPIYIFIWGDYQYLRCFVTKLDYTLKMFLPDGTPVRASVNLTLLETDAASSQGSTKASGRSSGSSRW